MNLKVLGWILALLVVVSASAGTSYYLLQNNKPPITENSTSEKKNVIKDKDSNKEESASEKSSMQNKSDSGKRRKGAVDEETIQKLAQGLNTRYDDMLDATVYDYDSHRHKGIEFSLYMVRKGKTNETVLKYYLNYQGEDWLFIKALAFKADNHRFFMEVGPLPSNEDVYSGGVEEVYDKIITDGQLYEDLKSLGNASEVKIRFMGKNGDVDITLPKEEVQNMTRILNLYGAIKQSGSDL